jgi:DNA modification methylase
VTRYPLPHGEIIHARVEQVYPTIADGSVTLVHSDGPYGMGKADWDRVKDLAAWYRPHIAEWGRICAASASVYVWNTAEGWAAVHPEMVGAGWTFKSKITWDKGNTQATKGVELARGWPDVTEVCAYYARNAWDGIALTDDIGHIVGADPRNWVRAWLGSEWDAAGLNRKDANVAIGSSTSGGGMAAHYFGANQWELPTWENYQRIAQYAAERGPIRKREYFVHPDAPDLAATWRMLDRFVADLRAEYEVLRVPFTLPPGITNVWSHPQVQGAERLIGADGATLHPCQKPLLFARRIIEASSRPQDLVFEPFGGTARIAVANEQIARYHPEEARRTLTVEMDEDGRGYIPAVLASLGQGDAEPVGKSGQTRLFA